MKNLQKLLMTSVLLAETSQRLSMSYESVKSKELLVDKELKSFNGIFDNNDITFPPYKRPKSKGNTKWKQRISNFLKS